MKVPSMKAPPELALVMARVEVKLDQVLHLATDHEQRLRKLEERRWPLPVTAVLASAVSLIGSITGVW